jgi:undecaprenyl-diphosphatase
MTLVPHASAGVNAELSFAVLLIGLGLLLVIIGLLHQTSAFSQRDAQTFLALHTGLRRYTGFFRFIWPLGTTPVGITLILIMFIASWQAGLIAALMYLLVAIVEWVIKRKLNRPRPYETLPAVVMSQPKQPSDASHPSGDTMRVWFLALVFPMAFGLSWPVLALTCTVAFTLSLGRIVLGVHYPLDIVGGAGLGILFTGLALISYHLVTDLQLPVFSL